MSKFEVGDIVKAVKPLGHNDVTGVIGIIRGNDGTGVVKYDVEFFGDKVEANTQDRSKRRKGGFWWCDDKQLEKLDPDLGNGWFIGDIVKYDLDGDEGVVVESHGDNCVGVIFEGKLKREYGHNLHGQTKHGGWWVRDITLVKRQARQAEREKPPQVIVIDDLTPVQDAPDRSVVLKQIPPAYRYIARDKDGKLFAYIDKPVRDVGGTQWYSERYKAIDAGLFPNIKWTDDPLEIR